MSSDATSKRRWSELSPTQRTGILALIAVQLGLQAAALRDLRHRPARKVRGPKRAWVAVSFVNFAGPLAYLRWGRRG